MAHHRGLVITLVIVLVVLGIAVVIGETTGDDTGDSAAADAAVSGNGYLSTARLSNAVSAGNDTFFVVFEGGSDGITVTARSEDVHGRSVPSCFTVTPTQVHLNDDVHRAEVAVVPRDRCPSATRVADQVWTYTIDAQGGKRLGEARITYDLTARRVSAWKCEPRLPISDCVARREQTFFFYIRG